MRALEARMVTVAQLQRMTAAADFEAAFSVLSETPYADYLAHLKSGFDFEDMLDKERAALKDLMDHLAPGNEIIAALFKKYEYQALKLKLRQAGTKDPQQIDIDLDKRYYSELKEVLGNSPSPLIRNLVNYQIDLINLKILLRLKELGKDKKALQNTLLEPGFVDKDIWISLLDQSIDDIRTKLSFTPYLPAVAEGFESLAEHKSFARLEKLMDDFIIEQFRKAKYLNSGVEPLVGFWLAKEAEIKTLRFILVSKLSHVDTGKIKSRLRVSYV